MEAINTVGMVRKLAECKDIEVSADQMLCRKIEKGTGRDSLAVVIAKPDQETFVVALENNTVLQAAYDWYLSQVEACCKGKMLPGSNILPSDYSIEAVSEYLEQNNIREGRVSKEKIEQWFASAVVPVLTSALQAKFADLSEDKLVHNLNAYRDSFKLLAKREIVLTQNQRDNLQKVIDLVPVDAMTAFCTTKITAAVEKSADMLAL